jgi:hypothetical protein
MNNILKRMPSMKIERNEQLAVTVEKTLKISVNKNCIMIQDETATVVHPASDITEFRMEINRQPQTSIHNRGYDNSAIYLNKISSKYHQPSIKTGPYTEKVYAFILKHMYGMDESDSDDDVSSCRSSPKPRTYGSGVLGTN